MPGFVSLTNRATGNDELIDTDQVPAALASGKYVDPGAVAVSSNGVNTYAPSAVAVRQQAFTPTIDPAQVALAQGHAIRARQNEGVVAGAKALAGGAVSGATAGLLDPFADEQEFHPIASTVGNIAGVVAPALLGDEAGLAGALPSSMISRAGGGLAERLGGGLAARTAGGAVEGALYGAGQGTGEILRSDDPITWEHAASTLSSNVLFGGALGAGAGALGHLAERGLSSVERGLQRATPLVEEGAAARAAADAVPQDLSALDVKGLRAAGEAERDALAAQQATARTAARSQAVDDALSYRAAVKEANPWLAIDEGEQRAQLSGANKGLRNAFDDPKGLRENPFALLKPLRKEEQALEGALAKREEILTRIGATNTKIAEGVSKDLAALADDATHVELSGKAAERYGAFTDTKVKRGSPLSVARDDAQRFVEAINNGEVAGATQGALDKMAGLLEQNRALQGKIKQSIAPLTSRAELTSERLTAVQNARDALAAPKAERASSLFEKAATGGVFGAIAGAVHAVPLVGQIPGLAHLVGAKGAEAIGNLVFGRMGKATAEIAAKTAATARAFAGAAEATTKFAPQVATAVLSDVRFAPPQPQQRGAAPAEPPKGLAALFKARTDEIKSQTVYDPSGQLVMRPEMRAQMAQVLKPIRVADPILADRIETLAARRIEYLSSLIPRRPDFGTPQIGPDRWQPSDLEMRSFARSVAAVEDPHSVEQRALHGTVTPEDAAAYWGVYPERAQAFKLAVLEGLQVSKKPLAYSRRLSLGILAGMPIDPSMSPRVLKVLQGQFTEEPGSEQGTSAPKPMPAFGSIKKSPDAPTPTQQRSAQGAL